MLDLFPLFVSAFCLSKSLNNRMAKDDNIKMSRYIILSNVIFSIFFVFKSLSSFIDLMHVTIIDKYAVRDFSKMTNFSDFLVNIMALMAFAQYFQLLWPGQLESRFSDKEINLSCCFYLIFAKLCFPSFNSFVSFVFGKIGTSFGNLEDFFYLLNFALEIVIILGAAISVFEFSSVILIQSIPTDQSKKIYRAIRNVERNENVLECTNIKCWLYRNGNKNLNLSMKMRINQDSNENEMLIFAFSQLKDLTDNVAIEIDKDDS
ncbi:hypothetical protein MHBO_002916 [Bonamia ostreae]